MPTAVHLLASLATAAVLVAGCGGSDDPPSPSRGTLKVSLTDAPGCGFDSVFVTVTGVRIHRAETAEDADGGWQELAVSPARRLDLLKLQNGVLSTLGQLELEPGRYSQIRLVLDSAPGANSVVPSGGQEVALRTPSAQQSGLKLKHAFDVEAGQTADLVLDFDACRSIVKAGASGNYLLKPVLHAIPVANGGVIEGSLGASGSGAVVSAQGTDETGAPVVLRSTTADASGRFKLAPVQATSATYRLVVQGAGLATHVVSGVPVSAGATTSVAPIELATSAMQTVSGAATAVPAAPVTVRALQAVADGVTVELGHQAVESGATWRLDLPVMPPRMATYGPSLPFALGTDAAKYRIEARTDALPSKPTDVDLSSGPVSLDISLP